MNTIQEIERAIQTLTPRELEELYSWLDQHCPQAVSIRRSTALWTMRKTVASSRFRNAASWSIAPLPNSGSTTTRYSRRSADKHFSLLKGNPQHRSLQFKKIGDRHGEEVYSARVTLSYRALASKRPYGFCGSGLATT